MPTIALDPDKISAAKLAAVFNTLVAASQGTGGGTIQMTDLLEIVNFPADVRQRIKDARGPVTVSECSTVAGGRKCKAKNTGTKIAQDLPGAGSVLGLIIHKNFSCTYQLTTADQRVKIEDIEGLEIDGPSILNFDVDAIEIEVPTKVVKITF